MRDNSQDATVDRTPAQIMMERETRLSYGPVPHALLEHEVPEMNWQMRGDRFLLRAPGDHYFHYRKGEGITIERGAGADISEESLWLNGSVYAAVASMNGLLPIHASAVAFDGAVYAFTGGAGSGKSTLAAALGNHGLPMFCDDTLVMDLSDPTTITCLPGHKRLKLKADAVEMTRASPQEKVSLTVDKFYAAPPGGDIRVAMPLARLFILEEGAPPQVVPITGGERMKRLQDDHYTADLFSVARSYGRADGFVHLSRLASQIDLARFVRPRDRSRFGETVAMVADHIMDGGRY